MADFFENIPPAAALELEKLTRLAYELREHHAAVLSEYDAGAAEGLLTRIVNGRIGEHPAYEHYLAARILDDTRQTARELIALKLKELGTA